jgi:hypothetical protein
MTRAPTDPASPDAGLLIAFAAWRDAEAAYAALAAEDAAAEAERRDDDEARGEARGRDASMRRLAARLRALRVKIARCPVRTMEGLCAKAEVAFSWFDIDGFADLDTAAEGYLGLALARDVIVFAGGADEMRGRVAAGAKRRRAWKRRCAAVQAAPPSPVIVEMDRRNQEEIEHFAALGLRRQSGLTWGEVCLGVWLAQRLILVGQVDAAREVVRLLHLRPDWCPPELAAATGLAWRH